MVALIFLFLNLIDSLLKAKNRLEAENAALRHQLLSNRARLGRAFLVSLQRAGRYAARPEWLIFFGLPQGWSFANSRLPDRQPGKPQIFTPVLGIIWRIPI